MNNNTIFDDIEDLDSTWIQEFENLDKDYKNYYTEDLSFLRIHSIYINTLNDIEYQWAFCRYFWEAHAILPTIPMNVLDKWNNYWKQ